MNANPSRLGVLRQHKLLIAICVYSALSWGGMSIIAPTLALYADSFGVSTSLVGLAVGAFGVGRLVTNMPAGYIGDTFGRRWILVIGSMVMAGASLLAAFSADYWQLVLARLLQGVGGGMWAVGAQVYMVDLAGPAKRARYLGYQAASAMAGSGLGPVVGGMASDAWGLHAPFHLLAGASAAAAVWALLQMPETKPAEARLGRHPERPDQEPSPGPAKHLLRDLTFWIVGIVALLMFANRFGSRQGIIPLYSVAKGLSGTEIGLVFAVGTVAQFAVTLLAGRGIDRVERRYSILAGAVVSTGGALLFVAWEHVLPLIVAIVVIRVGEAVLNMASDAYAADVAASHGRLARGMATYRTFGDAGSVLGPVLAGFLADVSGFPAATVALDVVLVAVALALVAATARHRAAERPLSKGPTSPCPGPPGHGMSA